MAIAPTDTTMTATYSPNSSDGLLDLAADVALRLAPLATLWASA